VVRNDGTHFEAILVFVQGGRTSRCRKFLSSRAWKGGREDFGQVIRAREKASRRGIKGDLVTENGIPEGGDGVRVGEVMMGWRGGNNWSGGIEGC
jgi:hypothetical protein